VRGSYGSGFRAPALAQSYFNQTNIVFVNGAPLRTRVVSVNDPVAPLIGASSLRPEKSKNLSLGTVVDFHGLTASFDYYKIAIDNRLAASSIFQSTGLTNLLAANGFPGLGGVSYVTNAVDTTTRGFDITARYRQDLGDWGNLATTLGVNRNRTRFDRIAGTPPALAAVGITTPLFDLTQQVRFKNSTPSDKISLNLNWTFDRFTIGLTNTRYGKVSQMAATNRTPAQVAALIQGYDVRLVPSAPGSANSDIIQSFGADIVTDLEASYRLSDRLTLSAGASNLFDKYPDKVLATTAATVAAGTSGSDNVGTLPYAIIAPYGFNGRFLYAKIGYKF
jgi:iron complex outermembrane receptor protein